MRVEEIKFLQRQVSLQDNDEEDDEEKEKRSKTEEREQRDKRRTKSRKWKQNTLVANMIRRGAMNGQRARNVTFPT
jgi:hypothetical protein